MDQEDDIPKKSDNEEEFDKEVMDLLAARTIVPPVNILIPVGVGVGVGVGVDVGVGVGAGVNVRLGEVVRGAHVEAVGGRARPIVDREVEMQVPMDGGADGDIDGDVDNLPQQAALAAQRGVRAAIRWALRGRHLDNNLDRNGNTGGLGERGRGDEEIDERDHIGEMMITGDMVDAEINRDRRIRFAEIAARRALLGGVPNNNLQRRSRRREKTCLVRDHLQGDNKKIFFLPQKSLPVNTPLCPDDHPRDFIAVVILDIVLKETVSVLDCLALELLPYYEEKIILNKSVKKDLNNNGKYDNNAKNKKYDNNDNNNTYDNNCKDLFSNDLCRVDKKFENQYLVEKDKLSRIDNNNESRLKTLAINVVRLILRSSYRKLLIPNVFRILIAHCGLRVKLAVADALQRF